MAESDKTPVTMEELLVSSLAQTDALAKLLIEKGFIRVGERDASKPAESSVRFIMKTEFLSSSLAALLLVGCRPATH